MFTCVDRDGNPLGYERDGTPVAMFFVDAARAEQELTMARTGWPESDFRVIGVGLGDVYRQALPADTRPQADTPRAACAPTRRPPLPAGRRTREGSALLVAGAAALERAGDEWDEEQLPLYTCLSLSQPQPDGAMATPFFLCPVMADASLEAAVSKSAAALSPDELAQLQLACTTLDTAVQMVLAGREREVCGDRFLFVAQHD